MKKFICLAVFIVAAFAFKQFDSRALHMMDTIEADQTLWSRYQSVVGLNFATKEEHSARFKIFRDNLISARLMEKMDAGSAMYGVALDGRMSPFLHISREEFATTYLSPMPSKVASGVLSDVSATLPDEYMTPSKYLAPVRNQGQCGSCWAHSTVENLESVYAMKNDAEVVPLSVSQLMDCSLNYHELGGCNGGLMNIADQWYIENNYGAETEADYGAYEPYERTCTQEASKMKVFPTKYMDVKDDVTAIKTALTTYGPLSVALNAEWMQTYMGGISDPLWCDAKSLDHGVAIDGYATGKHLGKEINYWKVRNSWGESWGEKGYYYLAFGKCGIETCVSTITAFQ